jgi:helicase MOV-10
MFVKWKHHPRPNRRFPVVFHAISGNDEREASSPSYFNRLEASQVKSYVKMLLTGGNIGPCRDQPTCCSSS